MESLNELLYKYLDAKQHVWNTYFYAEKEGEYEFEKWDDFKLINNCLFRSIVCYASGISVRPDFVLGSVDVADIIVKPKAFVSNISILLQLPHASQNSYWDVPRDFIADDVNLSFIEFFDWSNMTILSSYLVRCRVETCKSQTEYNGREGLVELQRVDFFRR